jgi:acyl-CoA thioester hydrolase
MNVAYFMLVFDHATDAFYPLIGLGKPYRQRTGKSTFAVESHITYQRELSVNEEVKVTTQLLGFDAKRIHYFHTMWHVEKKVQMATLEQLALHVDLTTRKVEPMPEESQRLIVDEVKPELARAPPGDSEMPWQGHQADERGGGDQQTPHREGAGAAPVAADPQRRDPC